MTKIKVIPLITLIMVACSGCKIGSHIAIVPAKVDSSESSIKEVEELINDYNNAVIAKKYSKIDELKPMNRDMIKYRYIEDLSIQEISKKLNQPINTTKIKIFRAKKLLSEKLKKND